MAHQAEVTVEQYEFKAATKKKLFILLGVGIALFVLGLILAIGGEGHEEHGGHASAAAQELVASATQHEAASEGHDAHAAGDHHETSIWLKRLYTTLWHNNVFFAGLGIIGLFFIAIQYAAQAGWSVGVKRIGLAMGSWIPVAGILMLGLFFFVKGDLFHWSHHGLFEEGGAEFDPI